MINLYWSIGKMIVDFTGFEISEALEYLRSQNIIVEKAGV